MKIIFVLITLFSSSLFAQASIPVRPIENWIPDLPINEMTLLESVQSEAAYYSFETDSGSCGGQISDLSLVEFKQTKKSYVTLSFKMTRSQNYCATEDQASCKSSFVIKPDGTHEMTKWSCN